MWGGGKLERKDRCVFITWRLDAGRGITIRVREESSVCVERMDGRGKNNGAGLGRVMPEAGKEGRPGGKSDG